ncbi:tyrosine-type recombinase/integrase [Pseudooceanicola sp. LIPI14-2-Ac024]|uniref:tyrosine-type recombinase/integrase n=1 Tax=Pseudooceanicola sp. LIPI14-2-Ac024 TaxID=3344875 RepID=UPI0035CF9FF8
MTGVRLTNARIAKLPAPEGRQKFVPDAEAPGLAVRLSPGGSKAFVFNYRDPATRKKRRKTIGKTNAMGIDAAREVARKLTVRIASGESLDFVEELTLDAAFEEYAVLRKPSTEGAYRRVWKYFVPANIKPIAVNRLTRKALLVGIDKLVANGQHGTAYLTYNLLHALLNHCVRRSYIDRNPLTGVRAPSKGPGRDRVLSDEELMAVLRAAEALSAEERVALWMLVVTGCRKSEVIEMRWPELQGDELVLPPERTKNGRGHRLSLPPGLAGQLKKLPKRDAHVFHFNGDVMRNRLRRMTGIADWSLHDLRRTAATNMARLGVAPHIIEAVINHKSGAVSGIAAVYNRYGYDAEKAQALVVYEGWLDEALGGSFSSTQVASNKRPRKSG